ncbi:MAG: type II toxin-antitoxin system VapC family toxin [Coriobacteriaceae bacterium]|nr:type II toxin-antitoxin system VapC family toxin [Coriobacteriaceae bacterium]
MYLMDSHVLLWIHDDNPALSNRARGIITDPRNEVYASTVSFWELSLKHALGKLPLAGVELEDFEGYLGDSGLGVIGLNERESLSFHRLPPVAGHRDPFDRMLIWQAISRGMSLISNDSSFEAYRAFGLHLTW